MHEETEDDARLDQLDQLLDRLSPDRQALIHALFVRGMSQREYAAIKGVNESSVRKQKHRTLRALKRMMDGGSPPDTQE